VDEAVFKSGVLDEECGMPYRSKLHRIKGRFHVPYYHKYILKWTSKSPDAPEWVRAVHEIANRLFDMSHVRYPQRNKSDYIYKLCYKVAPRCILRRSVDSQAFGITMTSLDNDVLCLAIYFDLLLVVKEMASTVIDGAVNWKDLRGAILGDPLDMAAEHNKVDMLKFMMLKLSAHHSLKATLHFPVLGRCLVKACQAGNMETVEALLTEPWAPAVHLGPLERNISGVGSWAVLDYALRTPNKAIFERILEYRQGTVLSGPIPPHLLRDIGSSWYLRSNKDMFRWFLNTHWSDSRGDFIPKAIASACREFDEDYVRVLLEYALPHYKKSPDALRYAVTSRCMDLVKLLVEQGYDVDESSDRPPGRFLDRPPPIVSAILLEDKDLFYYLLEHGAKFDTVATVGMAVGHAMVNGLESMLEFMVSEGVDVDLWWSTIVLEKAIPRPIGAASHRCGPCMQFSGVYH
jgi:hypothetical protein